MASTQHQQALTPDIARLYEIFDIQKAAFRKNPMPCAAERIAHLDSLHRAMIKHQATLLQAVSDDFGHRSKDETEIAEVITTLESIKYYQKNLRKWMRPSKRHVPIYHMPATAQVVYQPLGVIAIIVPWNYPILLALGPLICALAAGNRAMMKMSGFTPRLGEAMKVMLAEAFDESVVTVFTGRGEISETFPKLPFDQITFTGSTNVGRTIMAEAAKNLTPVLLELGGKSPAIIHESFPLEDAAERIAFGKCWNAGQTCVAPDYLLVPKGKAEAFVRAFTAQVSKMYPTMLNNPDFTSVVNEKQYTRIQSYLEDARAQGAKIVEINPANEAFVNTRKMPVTLVHGISADMQIMQNEIFGPVLAIMEYEKLDDAINFVNDRPRPLALYYFDWDYKRSRHVMDNTHSGGICINEVLSHVGIEDLPFGGVGASGMGKYHGPEGFYAMSNARSVLEKPKLYGVRYVLPPFDNRIKDLLKKLYLR